LAKRLFVGGLPYATSDHDLESLFTRSGNVTSATIVTDRFSGQSKGFGFVEMENDAEAEAAIAALNGTMLDGRTITVNEARPREERPRNRFGEGGGYGGQRERSGGNRGGRSGRW